ncbi:hypothetical protein MMC15_008195 [Xylographa vitiligo]|nr:hypothetical protein [Xylographa vitiligo]
MRYIWLSPSSDPTRFQIQVVPAEKVITPDFQVTEVNTSSTINLGIYMPRKISVEEALSFLYICLKNSDYKTIDFTKVGVAANLPEKSAQQRFRRLRQALDNGRAVASDFSSVRGASNQDDPADQGMEEC